jgi:RecB family exonuclease
MTTLPHFFNPEALANAPWSNSKLSTLENCPYKFSLQYTKKLRERDIPEDLKASVDKTATKYGTSVHRVSELVASGTSMDTAVAKVSKEEKLTRSEKSELKSGRKSILTFEDRISKFKERYSIIDDHLELELALGNHLEPTKYFSRSAAIRGKLDRTLFTRDKKVAVVIDLKTSARATLSYAGPQLDFYSTLILGNYPEVETVKTALYFTKVGTMLWNKTVSRQDYCMDADNSVINRVNTATLDLRSLEPEIKIHTLCKWCVYKEVCKKERKVRRKRDTEAAKA